MALKRQQKKRNGGNRRQKRRQQRVRNSKSLKKWERVEEIQRRQEGRQMEWIERDGEVKQTERKRERGDRKAERERDKERKQMAVEKRQIETRWEDNTGTASEAQRGGWKAEKCQRKKGGGGWERRMRGEDRAGRRERGSQSKTLTTFRENTRTPVFRDIKLEHDTC